MQPNIDVVAQDVRRHQGAVTLLIGAGCSVTGGIPTAAGFLDKLEAVFPQHAKAFREQKIKRSYGTWMNELSEGERNELVRECVKDCKVNWAHIGIATLMKQGVIDRVVTTNFDPLIARACAIANHFPPIYDLGHATSKSMAQHDFPAGSIIHLHGQSDGLRLLHTDKLLAEHAEKIKPIFGANKRLWIVVGYSGANDPLVKRMSDGIKGNVLYWIAHRDSVEVNVRQAMDSFREARRKLLTGYDADSFFTALCRKLDLFPPIFFDNPFGHLDAMFKNINAFDALPHGLGTTLPPEPTKQSHSGPPMGFEAIKDAIRVAEQMWEGNETRVLISLTIAGKHSEIVSRFSGNQRKLPPEARKMVANACVSAAENIATEVKGWSRKVESKVSQLFGLALKFDGASPNARIRWADLLGDWASNVEDNESDRLFGAAIGQYDLALRLRSDQPAALNNRGYTLRDWALKKTRSNANEASALLTRAMADLELSLKLRPRYFDAVINLGNVRADLAKLTKGKAASRHFEAAKALFERAIDLQPNIGRGANNMAVLLMERSEAVPGQRKTLLDTAKEYLKKAAARGSPTSNFNLACLEALLGHEAACRQRLLAEQPKDREFLKRLRIDPDLASLRDRKWFQNLCSEVHQGLKASDEPFDETSR